MPTGNLPALEAGSYEPLLQDVVTDQFGFASLSLDQDSIIRASIEGNDVLGILPTGGGKSACYQIPGIVTRSRTLVVSPLIALQDDQVRSLRKRGAQAFALHSGLDDMKRMAVHYYFKTAARDVPCFLYISPEMLLTDSFHERFDGAGFNRIAVDEAHCVSTWGNTFRPDYMRIRVAARRLGIPHCSAFTATIDPRIERDITERLSLRPDFVRVAASPFRPNLALKIERLVKETDSNRKMGEKKLVRLFQLLSLPEYQGPTIVYCNSRDGATSLYLRLRRFGTIVEGRGYKPFLFHANLPYEDKMEALTGFLEHPAPIVIATSAFGMGIDRADVRQVIHYGTPFTLVDYAQQIGRAGRDGLPSLCTTFHSETDYLENQLKKLEFELPTYDFATRVLEWVRDAASRIPSEKRKSYNLRRFLARTSIVVEHSEHIKRKQVYLDRVMSSVSLLQRTGLLKETGDGLVIHDMRPGGSASQKLMDLTQMHARMQVREKERLNEFFSDPDADQELLWELLARK